VERFNLVNDTWSAVRAGIASTPEYLAMVKQFAGETDPNVWAILNGSMRTLDMLLIGTARDALRKEVRVVARPAFNRLGFEGKDGETVQDKELRGSLLGLLGTIGEDKELREKAAKLFESWKKDKASIDSNLLPAAVGILAYIGDKARYDEFFDLYKKAGTPQEEQRFLGALTSFRDKDLLDRSIKLMLSEHVRTQDAPYIFAALLRNEVCGEAAWDFMRANWEALIKAFPENGVVRMIGGCDSLDTAELAAEVKSFFEKNQVKSGDMATAQMLEQLGVNVRLRQTESPKLSAHLVPAAKAPAPEKKEPVQAKK
jgi:aminopeptidase N